MSVRDNVWPPWECIVRCPGSPFLWKADLSREDSLLFGLLIPSPEVIPVECTNQTTVSLQGPLSECYESQLSHTDVFLSAHCLTWDPFLPHLPPGLVPYNLIQQTFTEYCYQRGAVPTLEIQREIGSLAQETPGLPAHSYLPWCLWLP